VVGVGSRETDVKQHNTLINRQIHLCGWAMGREVGLVGVTGAATPTTDQNQGSTLLHATQRGAVSSSSSPAPNHWIARGWREPVLAMPAAAGWPRPAPDRCSAAPGVRALRSPCCQPRMRAH
jgi:hypothetical protein